MTSIVIAAHNEEAVIGASLDALTADAQPGEFDIVVAANGCTDRTVTIARERAGVRVLDIPTAGKPGALNAADRIAAGFPRIYLDADIRASAAMVRTLAGAVGATDTSGPVTLAAVPARHLDTASSPALVRGYYAINARLPVFERGLFGRGMIALSEAGRSRFEVFPEMVADDLFLDSLFDEDEKSCVTSISTTIETPRTTRDLVRRLARVRSGNTSMRAAAEAGVVSIDVRAADRGSWIRDVMFRHPRLLPAGLAYAGLTVVAAVRAKLRPSGVTSWGRDESTRTGAAEPSRPA